MVMAIYGHIYGHLEFKIQMGGELHDTTPKPNTFQNVA